MYELRVQRVYDETRLPGLRILVDRLWPRGLSKQHADVAVWLKEVAPTQELRRWFGHEPEKFAEFTTRYRAELKMNPAQQEAFGQLVEKVTLGPVTLVYGAKDDVHNQAVVLYDIVIEALTNG